MKLNLGCGSQAISGFVNVDVLDLPGVDVMADVSGPLPFADGAADLVYASHVLEHFPTAAVPGILAEWRRVLRPGGVLLLAVPDLDMIALRLVESRGWFTPPHNPWLGLIYGGQKDDFDFHKTGFTAPWLTNALASADFGAIERVDWFAEVMRADLSRSSLPFGDNASLNMRAVAGSDAVDRHLLAKTRLETAFDAVDWVLSRALRGSTKLRSRVMNRRRVRLEQMVAPRQPSQRDL